MDAIDSVFDPLREFAKDSVRLVKRIYEGGVPYSYWVRGDGICRVLREADVHPYQQHHRWIWLVRKLVPGYEVERIVLFCALTLSEKKGTGNLGHMEAVDLGMINPALPFKNEDADEAWLTPLIWT
ncbi:uncharacterized protein LOC120016295 isoform X1 [Tripterygium wilfordii]|uniref:uncharacterized protein LOC120016295 isoform X1 n=1 Tax=Tripterygium wilfordii TaxID=458696 RepID=UPI0018F8376F|nr:uncharacterized protein LOC120016295 isoform X1 [Tripterygium wilfordii]